MAVKLRLRRMGRKKLPIWAVVAADVRSPRDGRFIEDLGRYYPLEEPARVVLKQERIMHWLTVGAQPTPTVRSLLSKEGLLLGLHLKRKGHSGEQVAEAVDAHRSRHAAKAEAAKKVTAADRRAVAMEAEIAEAAKREAEAAAARQKALEKKKAEAAEAAKAAEEAAASEAADESEATEE